MDETIKSATVGGERIIFDRFNDGLSPQKVGSTEIYTDGSLEFDAIDEKLWKVSIKDTRLTVDVRIKEEHDCYVSTVSKDYAYVAKFATHPFKYTIYCIDRKTKTIAWTQSIRTYNQMQFGSNSGGSAQFLKLLDSPQRLYVFGLVDNYGYIVGVSKDEGKITMRFSTVGDEVFLNQVKGFK